MDCRGMDQGRPSPMAELVEALQLEMKYQACLELSECSEDDVSGGVRDTFAHVLRCLKVWYDMPSDVLFLAVNIMDRFLTKMKVRRRHMACISVASFLLAARMLPTVTIPDPLDIIAISQSNCTVGDLDRMQAIIESKLEGDPHSTPVTPLTFVRILHSLCDAALYTPQLMLQLEILACDAQCANFRPSEIALAALSLDGFFQTELASAMNINEQRLEACSAVVQDVLQHYHDHAQVPHKQRLIWRLSQRTMRLLRPTDRLVRRLPTISEQGNSAVFNNDAWSDERPPSTFKLE